MYDPQVGSEVVNARFIDLLRSHLNRYPLAEVVDIYKLLYQAANGPRHLFDCGIDFADVSRMWEDAVDVISVPLEPISVDGELVRAHLGALKKAGVAFDDVWQALVATVQTFKPRPELIVGWWRDLGDLIKSQILPLPLQQYADLDDEFQKWGFLPKHHSKAFVEAYRPAYLVVLRRYIAPFVGASE